MDWALSFLPARQAQVADGAAGQEDTGWQPGSSWKVHLEDRTAKLEHMSHLQPVLSP